MAIKTKGNVVHILFVQMRINCKQLLIEIAANIIRGKLANYILYNCNLPNFLVEKLQYAYQHVFLYFKELYHHFRQLTDLNMPKLEIIRQLERD